MKLNIIIFLIGLAVCSSNSYSQQDINETDAQGKPHGIWKKYYEGTSQLRYEGEFKHGKEVGEFKFYCETCKEKPEAVLNYNAKNNTVHVQYFNAKGKLVSEGIMKDKNREGEWVTYHKNSTLPMIRENYSNGKLHGRKTVYYANGIPTEELDYKMGLREGENLYYSPSGVVIKRLLYKNDQLHGPATYYDALGEVIIEGSYKEDIKHGLWKYYKNGSLILEETFPKKH